MHYERLRELGLDDYSGSKVAEYQGGARETSAELSPLLSYILEELQRELGRTGNAGDFEEKGPDYFRKRLTAVAERLGFDISSYERDAILSLLETDKNSFGLLQKLVDDRDVSDIIVSHAAQVSVRKGGQTYRTGVRFPSQKYYESYVERLLYRAGTTCSTKRPIADGMLGREARVHVVHKSICDSGPYLTLRLNRFSSVKIEQLAKSGLSPEPVLQYLRLLVQDGQTLLLVGEVGSGKTTLARAVAAEIPAEDSILVIEDTPEIRLEHPQVRYLSTREDNVDGEGNVSPSQCIRAGMRMAMKRIIFGEMRDAEAAEAFIDVCSSGHPGLSTLHARSAAEALVRLELFLGRAQRGVGREVLQDQISTAVQAIVFIDFCQRTGRRRIFEVKEIGVVSDGRIRQRDIFEYVFDGKPIWKVKSKSSMYRSSLESGQSPLHLSKLDNEITLSSESLHREAALLQRAA